MARLESISVAFKYYDVHYHYTAGPRPSPLLRAILPALTYFGFRGDDSYLGDLMAGFDAPLLDGITLL